MQLLVLTTVIALLSAPPAVAEDCALPPAERAWIQQALDGWAEVRSDLLHLSPAPAPRIVFFDRRCAWLLTPDGEAGGLVFEGEPVGVSGRAHEGGQLSLPDGRTEPVEPMAYTSMDDEEGSFIVMATPSLWRGDAPSGEDPTLEAFFLGVVLHELAHTRQSGEISRRSGLLRDAGRRPGSIDDDIIENTFKVTPAFTALFERERELLFEAAVVEDDAQARDLAREALAMARDRRARFLVGQPVAYDILEDLYLNLEGVGCWVAYRMAQRHPDVYATDEQVITGRGRGQPWVQAEGLALMLLIERFAPDQMRRLMEPEVAAPFALLAAVLGEPWPAYEAPVETLAAAG